MQKTYGCSTNTDQSRITKILISTE